MATYVTLRQLCTTRVANVNGLRNVVDWQATTPHTSLSVQCYAWTEYKITCVGVCVCPSHFLSTRQVRHLNGFLQMTQIYARMCLLGSRWWIITFRGLKSPKTRILGDWTGISSQISKIQMSASSMTQFYNVCVTWYKLWHASCLCTSWLSSLNHHERHDQLDSCCFQSTQQIWTTHALSSWAQTPRTDGPRDLACQSIHGSFWGHMIIWF